MTAPHPQLVDPRLADSDSSDSGLADFSDFEGRAIADLGVEPLDPVVAHFEPGAVAPAAESLCLILVPQLPGTGMLWRRKGEQTERPEADYSEGA